MAKPVETLLLEGLEALSLDRSKLPQLLVYIELLLKWNKAYNLTASKYASDIVTRHLLDSLAVVPHLSVQSCCDIGTGGGFPGIPLAIYCPDTSFDLVDSNGKKTRFLAQVKAALKLSNVQIHESRVEDCELPSRVDGIISRAFTSLGNMCSLSQHMLSSAGHWYAMKSQHTASEIADLPDWVTVVRRIELTVPNLQEGRELLLLAANGNK